MSLAEQDLAGGGHGTAAGAPPANTDPHTGEVLTRSLVQCESVIERGFGTFVEVGEALMEIRDQRLYRSTHGDFDTYCRERWGMSRRNSDRLIDAAEVVGQLGPIGPTPQTESQARALSPVKNDPDKAREAMELAVAQAQADGAKLTADRIAGAVDEVLGNEPPPPPEPPAEMTDAERRAKDHAAHIVRSKKRLELFVEVFPQFIGLKSNPDREEILDALGAPDREEILSIERGMK